MPQLDLIPTDSLPPELRSCIERSPMPPAVERDLDRAESAASKRGENLHRIESYLTEHPCADVEAAGLWLLAGELERSHELSQDDGSATGSYWHGIMHRREGDFSNAKYWFNRAGRHQVFVRLVEIIQLRQTELELGDLTPEALTDPSRVASVLVDFCANAGLPDTAAQLCWWEWQLLFQHCRS